MSPRRPLRPCSGPGCNALVEHGRCPTCRQDRERRRGTTKQRDYAGRHVNWRKQILHRDPVCRGCQESSLPLSGDVDHEHHRRPGFSLVRAFGNHPATNCCIPALKSPAMTASERPEGLRE